MTSTSGLVESVTDLRRHLGSRVRVQRQVDLGALTVTTSVVPFGASIGVDLVLESIFDGVVVSGTIDVPWQGECRRCLGSVGGTIVLDLREVFEVAPTDGETWPLVADQIDLEPVVRDAALLALPLAPLCSDDCLGPSPERFPARVDGDRLSEDQEVAPAHDPRWAALDDLDLGS